MARPHIEFIQSRDLPELPVAEGVLAGTARRLLSHDSETGASTAAVTFPAGWTRDLSGIEGLLELFVLEGWLMLGATHLRRGAYLRTDRPSAAAELRALSPSSALVMLDPAATAERSGTGGEPLVLDSERLPWQTAEHLKGPKGVAMKALWDRTRPFTILIANVPRYDSGPEFHVCEEEIYVLEGDVGNEKGTMTPGCYFWRPAYVTHGPYRSETGLLCFLRSGGRGAHWIDDADATPEANRAYALAMGFPGATPAP